MPLTTDPNTLALSEDLIHQFEILFGQHPSFRRVHAKGALLTGTFKPSPAAASLTRAPHFNRESTPVTVRFSDNTGLPLVPDNDPNTNPRGFAVRFHLAEHVHTDIISHSTNGFPVRTGAEFLEFLRAIASSDPSKPHPTPIEQFLGSHPCALAFVQGSGNVPSSFATEAFFGVTAVRFINKDGATRFVRYRIVPEEGIDHIPAGAVAAMAPNFLFDELARRIGRQPIVFRVVAQLANDGDIVDDATIQWPEDRTLTDLGSITLTAPVADNAHEQKHLIFDPIPRVDGIDASADPLLDLRSAIYLISGRRRRSAPEEQQKGQTA